jgi:hypothetical protein
LTLVGPLSPRTSQSFHDRYGSGSGKPAQEVALMTLKNVVRTNGQRQIEDADNETTVRESGLDGDTHARLRSPAM